ncbi:hypothetical protein WICPIJ_007924 [Wickerhamomyces pijperi]|uniref:Mediator of RNA polymerase II transcription subunit 13 n=1 Tax=Wickerhamomyces pijperi TaxID=599730 RepID=A0A9P8Q1N4_WICPI|nr:hypothetical protein WICPIJ_007924 [Wickerhamomyces pijperi]
MTIIEAELSLRVKHPKILCVHYNRELWVFAIEPDEVPLVPDVEYGLSASDVKRFEFKSMSRAGNGTPSNIMTLLSVTFLRALKKLIIVQLADKGEIEPFANGGLLLNKSQMGRLLLVSPKLGYGGEIFVNLASREHNFKKLSTLDMFDPSVHGKYAIYLAPSGIRVYLTQATIKDSLTVMPSNSDTVAKMLKIYHGVTIDERNTTWINVIPNLSHINGITSVISKYLDPINNTKYLAWPLDLCYTQCSTSITIKTSSSSSPTASNETTPNSIFDHNVDSHITDMDEEDPLSLIDDFVQLKATATAKTPASTTMNTPMTHSTSINNMHNNGDFPGMSVNRYGSGLGTGYNGITPQSARDPMLHTNVNTVNTLNSPLNILRSSPAGLLPNGVTPLVDGIELAGLGGIADDVGQNQSQNQDQQGNELAQNWDDLDAELFGDVDDDFDLFGEENPTEKKTTDIQTNTGAGIDESVLDDDDDLLQADLESELELLTAHITGAPTDEQQHQQQQLAHPIEHEFDIPLNEITINTDNNNKPQFLSANHQPLSSVTPYNDPGAPLPAITPYSNQVHVSGINQPQQRKGSIFSPLNFNPIIKSGVDDKYANGGKFFVQLNSGSGGHGSGSGSGSISGSDGLKFRSEGGTPMTGSSLLNATNENAIISDTESEEEDDEDEDEYEEDNDSHYEATSNTATAVQDPMDIPLASTQQSPMFISGTGNELKSMELSMSPRLTADLEPDSKRRKLTSPSPQPLSATGVSSPSLPPIGTSSTQSNVPNVIPFLLRPVTIHSIPSKFYRFPTNTDKAKKPIITGSRLPELINQLAWTSTNLINEQLSFKKSSSETFSDVYPDSVKRAIAQIFPNFNECNIAEMAEIEGEVDSDDTFNLTELFSSGSSESHNKDHSGNPLSSDDPTNSSVNATNTTNNNTAMLPFKGHDAYGAELKPGLDGSQVTLDSILEEDQPRNADYHKSCWILPEPKMIVKRLSQEISVNSTALKLWSLLGFGPLHGVKNSQVIVVCPNVGNIPEMSSEFIQGVVEVYKQVQLGTLESLQVVNRSKGNSKTFFGVLSYDLDVVNWEERVKDIQFKSSGKDVLILFADFERSVSSVANIITMYDQLSKAVTKAQIKNGHFPVNLSLKIIPGSYITTNGVPSMLSMAKLTNICLSLYNNNIGDMTQESAKLATSLPSKINFQLTSKAVAESLLHEDIFIHLSYERSIDKEWLVASWCDNLCTVRKVRAWNCNSVGLDQTMNEMWTLTNEISSQLGSCCKKYLVLTRLDGVIPDDELSQWKRLSKSRDLSLIIVSVDVNPKLRVRVKDAKYPLNKIFNQSPSNVYNAKKNLLDGDKSDLLLASYGIPTVDSSTGLTPSSMFTPQPMVFANSPDLFTSQGTLRGGLSSLQHSSMTTHSMALDTTTTSTTAAVTSSSASPPEASTAIIDVSSVTYALILHTPSCLSNSPNRLSIKTGYLLSPLAGSNNIISTFEIQLLTCPNMFSSADDLMKVLMAQWRRFQSVGDAVYGVNMDSNDELADQDGSGDDESGVIPWNVKVVRRCIQTLVHLGYSRDDDEVDVEGL